MKTFVRDQTIRLKFNFRNHAGDIQNPTAGAQVSFSYIPMGGGDLTCVTYPLVQTGNDWIYEWDSAASDPGVIQVHAETLGGPPTSSIDTEFRLKANRANRELAGEW